MFNWEKIIVTFKKNQFLKIFLINMVCLLEVIYSNHPSNLINLNSSFYIMKCNHILYLNVQRHNSSLLSINVYCLIVPITDTNKSISRTIKEIIIYKISF